MLICGSWIHGWEGILLFISTFWLPRFSNTHFTNFFWIFITNLPFNIFNQNRINMLVRWLSTIKSFFRFPKILLTKHLLISFLITILSSNQLFFRIIRDNSSCSTAKETTQKTRYMNKFYYFFQKHPILGRLVFFYPGALIILTPWLLIEDWELLLALWFPVLGLSTSIDLRLYFSSSFNINLGLLGIIKAFSVNEEFKIVHDYSRMLLDILMPVEFKLFEFRWNYTEVDYIWDVFCA